MVYELAAFIRFADRVEKEDARRHWAKVHAPKVMEIPGVLRYVQNDIVEPLHVGSGSSISFDGYLCQWYLDEDSVTRAQSSPEWGAVGEDAESFIDPRSVMGPVEEWVVREGVGSGLKVVAVFEPGAAGEGAASELRDAVLTVAATSRYVENRRVETPGWNLSVDRFAELWMGNGGGDVEDILRSCIRTVSEKREGGGVSWVAIVREREV